MGEIISLNVQSVQNVKSRVLAIKSEIDSYSSLGSVLSSTKGSTASEINNYAAELDSSKSKLSALCGAAAQYLDQLCENFITADAESADIQGN